jgi:hypothetical protein
VAVNPVLAQRRPTVNTSNQKVSELWIAGVHSDVGGGYPASSGRLWAITLKWMAKQAHHAGLSIDDTRTGFTTSAAR